MAGSITALLGLGLRNLRARPGSARAVSSQAVVALTAAVPLFARSVATELFVDRTGGIDEPRPGWPGTAASTDPRAGSDSTKSMDSSVPRRRTGCRCRMHARSLVDSVRLQVEDGGGESPGSTSLSWHDDLDLPLDVVEGSSPPPMSPSASRSPWRSRRRPPPSERPSAIGSLTSRSLDGVEFPVTVVAPGRATPDDGWVTPPTGSPTGSSPAGSSSRRSSMWFPRRRLRPGGRWSLSTSADGVSPTGPRNSLPSPAPSFAARRQWPGRERRRAGGAARRIRRRHRLTPDGDRHGALLIACSCSPARAARPPAGGNSISGGCGRDDRQVGVVIAVESVLLGALAFVLVCCCAVAHDGTAPFDGFLDPTVASVRSSCSAPSLPTWRSGHARRRCAAPLRASCARDRRGSGRVRRHARHRSDRGRWLRGRPIVRILRRSSFLLLAAVVVGVLGWSLRPVAAGGGRRGGGRTAAQPVGLAVRRLGGRIGWVAARPRCWRSASQPQAAAAVGRSTDERPSRGPARRGRRSIQETLALHLPVTTDSDLRPSRRSDGDDRRGRRSAGTWTGSVEPSRRSSTEMTHLTLEPDTFASVAWWRDDYAPMALADLLGSMAAPDDVLVSRSWPPPATGPTPCSRAPRSRSTPTWSASSTVSRPGRPTMLRRWSPAGSISSTRSSANRARTQAPPTRRSTPAPSPARPPSSRASRRPRVSSCADPIRCARRLRRVLGRHRALLGIGLLGAVVSAPADGARSGERSLLRAIGFGPGALGRAASWEVGLVSFAAIVGVGIATGFQTLLLGSLLDAGAGTLRCRSSRRASPPAVLRRPRTLARRDRRTRAATSCPPHRRQRLRDEGREVGR